MPLQTLTQFGMREKVSMRNIGLELGRTAPILHSRSTLEQNLFPYPLSKDPFYPLKFGSGQLHVKLFYGTRGGPIAAPSYVMEYADSYL